jgi:NAD(P)-dependent dehydrogenase (short-subunit alcohol dehydrogenase family)
MAQYVITGGSSGVGAALITRLVDSGHTVFNIDVSPPAAGSTGTFIECHLGEPARIALAVNRLPARIDGLANVAGMARSPDPVTVMAVNFLGMRELTRQLTPRLNPGSGIVCVSSIAGRDWKGRLEKLRPLMATEDMVNGLAWCRAHADLFARDPYTWSKRAVTAWVMEEARHHARQSTRVLSVSPGGINTPLTPQFNALMGEAQAEWTNAQTGRAATPLEIAEVIQMLLCQPCGWLNGVDIPVDRGYSAGIDAGWIDFRQSPAMLAKAARDSTRH